MSSYQVHHLQDDQLFERTNIHLNDRVIRNESKWQSYRVDPAIEAFHRTLPDYAETKLHDLTHLAAELGVAHVFVKDESTRFGLPAFKILGASWAIHRAVCQKLGVSHSTPLEALREMVAGKSSSSNPIRLVLCTEGNWGRASARMSKYLGITATIYVPGFMSEYTANLIRAESAEVIVLKDGSYDDCIAATKVDADNTGALMVMDVSWDGYEQIPQVRASPSRCDHSQNELTGSCC